jgi:hypothetical protein
MVGMFISLIVVLAVYGSASFFESGRRQMVGGDEAFENAMAALLATQASVRQAGLSLVRDGRVACHSLNVFLNGQVRADAAAIAPVRISDGGADPDVVTIAFAESLQAAMPAQSIRPMAAEDSAVLIRNSIGLSPGDLVLVGVPIAGVPCTVMQITGIEDSAMPLGKRLLLEGPAAWNPANRAAAFAAMPAYPSGSLVQKLGRLNWLSYRVTDNRLEVVDNTTGETSVLAEHIVHMKAAYGTTNGLEPTIEQWATPTGAWAAPDPSQFEAVRALQLAVVARNPERVKPRVPGGDCDATTEPMLELWPGGPQVDLSRLGNEWDCFTYRHLRLATPLRNASAEG